MGLISYALSQASIILRVKIFDSTATTPTLAGKTGLTGSSSGLIIATLADNEATTTSYTAAASHVQTITTLGTYAAPSASNCRFAEVDSTNHPGIYEIQLANARYAVASSKSLLITIVGATGAAQCDVTIPLTSVNPYDSVRGGMTALPNAAAASAGGLPTSGAGANQITTNSSGQVVVGLNNDKTGYTLTQTFPSNFPTLSIDGSGKVLLQATQTGVTIPTVTTVTSQLTAAAIATGLWQDTTAGDFTVASSIGKSLYTGNHAPGAAFGLSIVGSSMDVSSINSISTSSVTTVSAFIGNTGAAINGTAVNTLASHDPGATIASATNITAGTITTVTNLTNAPTAGDFTAAMKTSLNAATPASVQNIPIDGSFQVNTVKWSGLGIPPAGIIPGLFDAAAVFGAPYGLLATGGDNGVAGSYPPSFLDSSGRPIFGFNITGAQIYLGASSRWHISPPSGSDWINPVNGVPIGTYSLAGHPDVVVTAIDIGSMVTDFFKTGTLVGSDWVFSANTLQHAASESPVGPGSIPVDVTVNDSLGNPVQGVAVWITTDQVGTATIAGTIYTNTAGLAMFMLDAGTYYCWRQRTGYNFPNPQQIVVS